MHRDLLLMVVYSTDKAETMFNSFMSTVIIMRNVVLTFDTFENNLGVNHKFSKELMESFVLCLDLHIVFKYFLKIAFVKEISPRE